MNGDLPYIKIGFSNDCDAVNHTPINDSVEVEGLLSSNQERFDLKYVASVIVRESQKASKRLAQKILTFLHASSSNT